MVRGVSKTYHLHFAGVLFKQRALTTDIAFDATLDDLVLIQLRTKSTQFL